MSDSTPDLSSLPLTQFSGHVAAQGHAMAGATIAASAALACGLGEACVRISANRLQDAGMQRSAASVADRLAQLRLELLALADEDGGAITAFAALREAGQTLQGQELLCRLPVNMVELAVEAAMLLQDFRPLAVAAEDDLEMAIRLLDGCARAATLLLDSNLRIWPEEDLLNGFEPQLAGLRRRLGRVQPVESVR
ncbi:MAG: cyclodeaminase/cyclohydrolase family protein [Caldilineales bacterium]|nr:cyclodeaminase/cyclohydrolase family protein [Caldilineales bacterium]